MFRGMPCLPPVQRERDLHDCRDQFEHDQNDDRRLEPRRSVGINNVCKRLRGVADHLDVELLDDRAHVVHAHSAARRPARLHIELGLADGLGELRATLQSRYGAKVHLPVIAQRRRLLSRFGLGTAIDGIGPSTLAALEERLHWQRFGL